MVEVKSNLKALDTASAPKKARRKLTLMRVLPLSLVMLLVFVGQASAESVNWTDIGEIISGAATLMPSIQVLIVSVIGIIFVLIMVGFVTGLFRAIIEGIQDALKIFR